jgi:hypothetical protein
MLEKKHDSARAKESDALAEKRRWVRHVVKHLEHADGVERLGLEEPRHHHPGLDAIADSWTSRRHGRRARVDASDVLEPLVKRLFEDEPAATTDLQQ